jgi:hypothetical protein
MEQLSMSERLFRPSPGQIHVLLVIGFSSVGYAIYLRYLALEYAPVALACQGGLQSWLCTTFRGVIILFNNSVFGWVAIAVAALNLIHPSIVLFALGLAASGTGLVLHNAGMAGLAAALLVVSLARRAPVGEEQQA